MIYAKIFKLENLGWHCDNPKCVYNPEFHYKLFKDSPTFYIKEGTTCLTLSVRGAKDLYCRPCIDVVYAQLKPILDSKLWIFE